jgi:hypothetical protein
MKSPVRARSTDPPTSAAAIQDPANRRPPMTTANTSPQMPIASSHARLLETCGRRTTGRAGPGLRPRAVSPVPPPTIAIPASNPAVDVNQVGRAHGGGSVRFGAARRGSFRSGATSRGRSLSLTICSAPGRARAVPTLGNHDQPHTQNWTLTCTLSTGPLGANVRQRHLFVRLSSLHPTRPPQRANRRPRDWNHS